MTNVNMNFVVLRNLRRVRKKRNFVCFRFSCQKAKWTIFSLQEKKGAERFNRNGKKMPFNFAIFGFVCASNRPKKTPGGAMKFRSRRLGDNRILVEIDEENLFLFFLFDEKRNSVERKNLFWNRFSFELKISRRICPKNSKRLGFRLLTLIRVQRWRRRFVFVRLKKCSVNVTNDVGVRNFAQTRIGAQHFVNLVKILVVHRRFFLFDLIRTFGRVIFVEKKNDENDEKTHFQWRKHCFFDAFFFLWWASNLKGKKGTKKNESTQLVRATKKMPNIPRWTSRETERDKQREENIFRQIEIQRDRRRIVGINFHKTPEKNSFLIMFLSFRARFSSSFHRNFH